MEKQLNVCVTKPQTKRLSEKAAFFIISHLEVAFTTPNVIKCLWASPEPVGRLKSDFTLEILLFWFVKCQFVAIKRNCFDTGKSEVRLKMPCFAKSCQKDCAKPANKHLIYYA